MTTQSNLAPCDLFEKLNNNEIQLIDIREPHEFQQQHIPGAELVPLSALSNGHQIKASGKTVVFMCLSGMRTESNFAKLATIVTGAAFKLEGGLNGWKRAGYSIAQS